MRRITQEILGVGMAASAALGALSGCGSIGPETIEQPAQIVGFAHSVDSQLWGKHWVPHYDEVDAPSGVVRNQVPHEEFDHCEAVDDEWLSWNTDDDECGGDDWFAEEGAACDADEYEHCEAEYITKYDYEQLEDYVIQDCRALRVREESKPVEPKTNLDCARRRGDGQWVTSQDVFIVWVTTKNPEYDEEKPDEAKPYLNGSGQLDPSEWQLAARSGVNVQASITDGRIVDVTVEPK